MLYPEHDCMLQCLVQREMMHEKGVYLKPLVKTCPNAKIQLQKNPGQDLAKNDRLQASNDLWLRKVGKKAC